MSSKMTLTQRRHFNPSLYDASKFFFSARICKRLKAQDSIQRNRYRQAGNRFLGSVKGLQIRALDVICNAIVSIPHQGVMVSTIELEELKKYVMPIFEWSKNWKGQRTERGAACRTMQNCQYFRYRTGSGISIFVPTGTVLIGCRTVRHSGIS